MKEGTAKLSEGAVTSAQAGAEIGLGLLRS